MKAVALWWSNYVALLSSDELREHTLLAGETPAAALLSLLGQMQQKPTALRLIYQPQDLQSMPVDCPKGSRKSIQQALAPDHPALTTDLVVWACQPLIATARGASTVLSLERTPNLRRFAEALAKARIRLDGAFPIAAVLERLPAFAGDGPAIGILHSASLGLLYTRDASGVRNVAPISDGADTEARALELFSTHIHTFHVPPQVSIAHTTATPWPFEAPGVTVTTADLSVFLQEAEKLSLSSLSNFLPPSRLPSPSSVAILAASLAILASAMVVIRHEARLADERAQALLKADRRASLDQELNGRRSNQSAIARATALAADIGASPAALAPLLGFLEAELPRELTLTDLRYERGVFTIEGSVHSGDGAAEGPFFAFYDSLSAPSRPWRISTKRPTAASASFNLSGSFQ